MKHRASSEHVRFHAMQILEHALRVASISLGMASLESEIARQQSRAARRPVRSLRFRHSFPRVSCSLCNSLQRGCPVFTSSLCATHRQFDSDSGTRSQCATMRPSTCSADSPTTATTRRTTCRGAFHRFHTLHLAIRNRFY